MTPAPGATENGECGGETKAEPAKGKGAVTEHPAPVTRPPSAQQATRAPVGRAEDQSPADKVSVYVYNDVPALDHSGLIQCYRDRNDGVPPWQDERVDVAQDMGEIWLHRYGEQSYFR